MAKLPPIYTDHGRTYEADTCVSLHEAASAGELRFDALAHGHYPGRRLPRNSLSAVKTVGLWDAEHDQHWGLPWHRNEGLELTYLERGTLPFAVDQQQFVLHADDLTITRPWQPHRVGAPHVTAGRLHWVILDVGIRHPHQPWRWPRWLVLTKQDIEELTSFLSQNEQPVWRASDALRRCFQQIALAVETHDERASVSWLAVYLNELLLQLLSLLRDQQAPLDQRLTQTQRTVELFWADLRGNPEHLALEWTVPRMAAQCGLGVTQFLQYSKQLTNMTPAQFLNYCRTEAAAKMLRDNGSTSVTDIALSCGFSSSQYFASVFRRHYGCTPNDYRHNGGC
jgi:AraC family L-rhamnose operon regulatory protein RhaS